LFDLKEKTSSARHFVDYLTVKIFYPTVYKFVQPTKAMTTFVKNRFKNKSLVGIVIGTASGENAENIMKNLNISKLFLIDPYASYKEDEKTINRSRDLKLASKRLTKFGNRIFFIRDYSSNAAKKFKNNSIDFVYIDGNHSYDFVKKDIMSYYPKVKKDGVIGGHDFYVEYPGVCKAVLEFVNEKKLKLFGAQLDWWVIKK